jgi:hypothetical protein
MSFDRCRFGLALVMSLHFGCATGDAGPPPEAPTGDVVEVDDAAPLEEAVSFPMLDRPAADDVVAPDAAAPDATAPDATAPDATAPDAPVDLGLSCPPPRAACGGGCVDTSLSLAHCGGCDRRCATGEACVGGVCRASCAAPRSTCAGACVDTMTDTANCGGCGRGCAAGQTCSAGTCAGGTMTSTSLLGQACRSATQCGTLACITIFPGGYCSRPCEITPDCGPDGVCVDDGAGLVSCARRCTADAMCRAGYSCLQLAAARACLPL